MKTRRWFGLFRHHEHFAQMRREIKSGDTVVYEEYNLYGDLNAIKSAVVQMVSDRWVFVPGDQAIPWNHILEWYPCISRIPGDLP